ncbi:hypothetical protein [Bacillus sp. COPE52]|uniref:hypothetical protein n=1 Tax=Bacillus sp. COPE52 TaxID=2233998 RepID=UPI000E10282B|nr:hypothetical protein [Bacillus sp. COPE52]AXK19156.1 hypothetical protein DPQ31_16230 [Bacillus sp. COPE52]
MKTMVRKGTSNTSFMIVEKNKREGLPFPVTAPDVLTLIRKTDELMERGYDFKTQIYRVIEVKTLENRGVYTRALNPVKKSNADVRGRHDKERIYFECLMVKIQNY